MVQISVAIALIVFAICMRLLPHSANFAPIMAIAIFGGAVLPKRVAVWVPLLAMMVSDAIIGFYPMMWVTWSCFLVVALVSNQLLRRPSIAKGALLTVSASLFFFVVTNFAVWVTSGMYAHTYEGLMQCYIAAIPFFRNTLSSDVIYTAALFGVYAFATMSVTRRLSEQSEAAS